MWTANYFPARYWAPRYWPKVGADPVVPHALHPWKKVIDDSNWQHAGYLQSNWAKTIDDSNWIGRGP